MPEPDQTQHKGEILESWVFPEFVQHERSRAWYLWFMAAVAGLLVFAILSTNYTFAAVIVVATVILVIRLRQHPPDVQFSIREEGIEVGERFYAWRELKEYWIVYQPPAVKKLYFEFNSRIRPPMEISLLDQNPLKLRQLLNEYLLENVKREEEPVSDQWSRMLKI